MGVFSGLVSGIFQEKTLENPRSTIGKTLEYPRKAYGDMGSDWVGLVWDYFGSSPKSPALCFSF